uniref:Uncharacterized protein n=1 Tax=Pavo cristatus TaxID=9049 RepID=A0A8C9L9K0_PAVCR
MFSFFRKGQDTKKITVQEREADGFVICLPHSHTATAVHSTSVFNLASFLFLEILSVNI